MFTAILFVCSLTDSTNCYKLVDNRGPYETEEKCLTRVEEMIKDTPNVLPITEPLGLPVINIMIKKELKVYKHD